jgi:hypothetical protein
MTQSGHRRLRIAAVQTEPTPFHQSQIPAVIGNRVGAVLSPGQRQCDDASSLLYSVVLQEPYGGTAHAPSRSQLLVFSMRARPMDTRRKSLSSRRACVKMVTLKAKTLRSRPARITRITESKDESHSTPSPQGCAAGESGRIAISGKVGHLAVGRPYY